MNVEEDASIRKTKAWQHLEQAYAYEEKNQFEDALRECESAIQLIPDWADAHNLRGIVLEALDRKQEALTAYRMASRLAPGFEEARDNWRELASELAKRHQLITIARFSYPTEAYIAKTRLQALGIPSFLADEHLITMNWLYSNVVGGVKLQVRRCDVARALRILRDEPYDPTIRGVDPQCPKCKSFDVRYDKYALRLVFLSWLLFAMLGPILAAGGPLNWGFPLPFPKRRWTCRTCGYAWRKTV